MLDSQGLVEGVVVKDVVSLALAELLSEEIPEGEVDGEGEWLVEGHWEALWVRVEDVEVDAVDDKDTLLVRQSVGEEDRVVDRVLVPLALLERHWEPLNVKVARALADL